MLVVDWIIFQLIARLGGHRIFWFILCFGRVVPKWPLQFRPNTAAWRVSCNVATSAAKAQSHRTTGNSAVDLEANWSSRRYEQKTTSASAPHLHQFGSEFHVALRWLRQACTVWHFHQWVSNVTLMFMLLTVTVFTRRCSCRSTCSCSCCNSCCGHDSSSSSSSSSRRCISSCSCSFRSYRLAVVVV